VGLDIEAAPLAASPLSRPGQRPALIQASTGQIWASTEQDA